MTDACIDVLVVGHDDGVHIPLFANSRYRGCKISKTGQILDSSVELEGVEVAQHDALRDFSNHKIDRSGNIYEGPRVNGHTMNYPELADDCGFRTVTIGYCRQEVADKLEWPLKSVRLMSSTGQLYVDDREVLRDTQVLMAMHAPWRVDVSVQLGCTVDAAMVSVSTSRQRKTFDLSCLPADLPARPGQATVARLKDRIASRVDLPMSVLGARWISPELEDQQQIATRHRSSIVGMAKGVGHRTNRRGSFDTYGSKNPALDVKLKNRMTSLRQSVIRRSSDVRPASGQLGLSTDLCSLSVGAAIFRPTARAFRLLVELACREELWKWAKKNESTLLLARLRPEQIQMNLSKARQVLNSPCTTSTGDLTITFRELVDEIITLDVVLHGARGTVAYDSNGNDNFHSLVVQLPPNWPSEMPRARFTSPMYHCNVCEDGTIPSSALGFLEDDWDASKPIFTYLFGVTQLLAIPDPYCAAPARPDLAAQLRSDPFGYQEAVRAVMS